jgi:hypothetical protein
MQECMRCVANVWLFRRNENGRPCLPIQLAQLTKSKEMLGRFLPGEKANELEAASC